ncbi:MAG: toll/interleukin-1 receptor domain-containing protein [Candidatus Competibacteraceae bacterium]
MSKEFIFLSYSRVDQPAVEVIAERLRQEGLNPWLDIWNLIRGTYR